MSNCLCCVRGAFDSCPLFLGAKEISPDRSHPLCGHHFRVQNATKRMIRSRRRERSRAENTRGPTTLFCGTPANCLWSRHGSSQRPCSVLAWPQPCFERTRACNLDGAKKEQGPPFELLWSVRRTPCIPRYTVVTPPKGVPLFVFFAKKSLSLCPEI